MTSVHRPRDDRPVVAATRRLPDAVERRLRDRFEFLPNVGDAPPDAAALARLLASADGVLCTVTDRIDRALLARGDRRTRILANFGVGVNHVELAAAREAGVVVTNTPDVLTDDTADLALALMLAAARRMGEGERELRRGDWAGWRPTHMLGARVSGRTLGVVGFGRIGRAVARRARLGLGMSVLAYGPRLAPDEAMAEGVEPVASLDELLGRADFVSLHCPATPETHHLIDERRLARMRPGAVLVNTARGSVVDEAALAAALRSGTIRAAGLDVYEREPAVHPDLLALENVVLLPHLGSATADTREAMGHRAADNLEAFFSGRQPPDRVA
ncbi:MAG: 2-hydroxyacid dehydrogenase [Gemmatimonadaceae bacterium]